MTNDLIIAEAVQRPYNVGCLDVEACGRFILDESEKTLPDDPSTRRAKQVPPLVTNAYTISSTVSSSPLIRLPLSRVPMNPGPLRFGEQYDRQTLVTRRPKLRMLVLGSLRAALK